MKNKWFGIIAFVVLIVAVLLSVAFCSRNEEIPIEPTVAPTAAPTEEPAETPTEISTEAPAPTEPEWVLGHARASYAEAIFATLEKNAEVEVIGKFMDYFVIAGEEYDLLVEERFVRMENEDAFESWKGYAYPDTNVFETVYMREEPIHQLARNKEVTVLEGKGNWLFIEWDGGQGYVKAADISKNRLGGGAGGSNNNAPADGTDVDVGSLSYVGQTSCSTVALGIYYGPEMEAGFENGTGLVLAESIEAYIRLYNHGDEVKVLEYDELTCVVYLENEVKATLPRFLVKLEGDEQEESWTGYAHSKAGVYEEYQRRNERTALKMNTEVEVLYKLPGIDYEDEGVYVVSIDGEILYMHVSEVSETKLRPATGGGGGGTGGNVWTPPAL